MTAWIVAGVLAAGSFLGWLRWRQLARAEFIRSYTFPHGLFDKVRAKRSSIRRSCSWSRMRYGSSSSRI